MREAPDVAKFLTNFLPADVAVLSFGEGEGAGILLDGGVQIFLKLRSFSQLLSSARGGERVVAGLKILTRRSQVFQLEVQVAPQEVSVGEIVPFLEFPLFGGDPRRAFGGRSAIHGIKNACGVADRPAESSGVLLAFEKFNGE